MPEVRILTEYCKGCGLCVAVCPTEKLVISRTLSPLGVYPAAVRSEVECKLCFNCTVMCPDAAIEIIDVSTSERAAAKKRKG